MPCVVVSPWRRLARQALLAFALCCALVPAVRADDDARDHDQARQALEQGRVLRMSQVLDKIEREQRGQVLKIEFEREDGRYLYKIRLLQADGRLAKLKVDAVDGRVLSIKRKD